MPDKTCKIRQDNTRQNKARQDKIDKTRQDKTKRDKTRQDRQDKTTWSTFKLHHTNSRNTLCSGPNYRPEDVPINFKENNSIWTSQFLVVVILSWLCRKRHEALFTAHSLLDVDLLVNFYSVISLTLLPFHALPLDQWWPLAGRSRTNLESTIKKVINCCVSRFASLVISTCVVLPCLHQMLVSFSNVVSMLDHRQRRCSSMETTLGKHMCYTKQLRDASPIIWIMFIDAVCC